MYRVQELCFFLCAISLIKATSIKIDSYTDSEYARDLENDTSKSNRKTIVVDKKTTTEYQNDLDEEDSDSSDSSESQTSLNEDKDESDNDSVPNISDYNIHQTVRKPYWIKSSNYINKTHDFNIEALEKSTLRSSFIYDDTFTVKENQNINDFYNYVLNETQKNFDTVKHKTKQEKLKWLIDQLASNYTAKFNEFHQDIAKQKIKTRLGTQKVILNSIEASTHFVNRLLNSVMSDMSLADPTGETANTLKQMVKRAEKQELDHACKSFGICPSKDFFSEFISKVLEIILLYDKEKFKKIMDAFTEELKEYDSSVLEHKAQHNLHAIINIYEKGDVDNTRTIVAILKNTIDNRNKPIIVNPIIPSRIVNSTLALLEIIDLFDANIDESYATIEKWAKTKDRLKDFGDGEINDIQSVVRLFVGNIKENINMLDKESRGILKKHAGTVLNFN